ncbi:hypothetical protein BJ508DRAFT_314089 [Ascobolus immersus RN42]|uniref:Uncharacterized protein n=1 Tax=Ascobolus immersus RN42 TaxID=1160509 RepID=A0A3N4HGE5_ASCIM|nr:hypothetical protein BJ508DRAFT_314089 [Ascobolus immersus RN42]
MLTVQVLHPDSPERRISAVRLTSSKHHFIDIRIRPHPEAKVFWQKPLNPDLRCLSPFAKYENPELVRCSVGRIATFKNPDWHTRREFSIDTKPIDGAETDERATIKACEDDWSYEETIWLRPGPHGEVRKPIREKWMGMSSAWNQTVVLSLVEVLPGKPTKSSKGRRSKADTRNVDCQDARGMVIRIGHYIQAAMIVNGRLTVERWSFSPLKGQGRFGGRGAYEWQQILRMGQDKLPCKIVMGGSKRNTADSTTWEPPVTVGHEHQEGRFVWRVIETETHPDTTIPHLRGGKTPWLRNQARPNPDFIPHPIHSKAVDDIQVEYDPRPEAIFEMNPSIGEFVPATRGGRAASESEYTSGKWHPAQQHPTRMRRAESIFMPPKDWRRGRRRSSSASTASPFIPAPLSAPASPIPIKVRPRQESIHHQIQSHFPPLGHQPPARLPPLPVKPPPGVALSPIPSPKTSPRLPPPPPPVSLPPHPFPNGYVLPPPSYPCYEYSPTHTVPFIRFFPFPAEPPATAPPLPAEPQVTAPPPAFASQMPEPPLFGCQPAPDAYPDFCEEAEKFKYWSFHLPRHNYLDEKVQDKVREFHLPDSCHKRNWTEDWRGYFARRTKSPQPETTPKEENGLQHTGVPSLFAPLLTSLAKRTPFLFTPSERDQLRKHQKASPLPPQSPIASEVSSVATSSSSEDAIFLTRSIEEEDSEYETDSEDESIVFILAQPRPTGMFKCFQAPSSPETSKERRPSSNASSPRAKKEDRSIPIMDPSNGHSLFELPRSRPRASTAIRISPPPHLDAITTITPTSKALSTSPPTTRRSIAVERAYPSPAPSPVPSETGTWTPKDELSERLDNIDLAIRTSAWSVNGELIFPTSLAREPTEWCGDVKARIDRSGVITSVVQPESPSVEELRVLGG